MALWCLSVSSYLVGSGIAALVAVCSSTMRGHTCATAQGFSVRRLKTSAFDTVGDRRVSIVLEQTSIVVARQNMVFSANDLMALAGSHAADVSPIEVTVIEVTGIAFGLAAIIKFKEHKDNPTVIPLHGDIAVEFVGVAMHAALDLFHFH
jgi:hypothetical protein